MALPKQQSSSCTLVVRCTLEELQPHPGQSANSSQQFLDRIKFMPTSFRHLSISNLCILGKTKHHQHLQSTTNTTPSCSSQPVSYTKRQFEITEDGNQINQASGCKPKEMQCTRCLRSSQPNINPKTTEGRLIALSFKIDALPHSSTKRDR